MSPVAARAPSIWHLLRRIEGIAEYQWSGVAGMASRTYAAEDALMETRCGSWSAAEKSVRARYERAAEELLAAVGLEDARAASAGAPA